MRVHRVITSSERFECIAVTNFSGCEKNSFLRTALFWVITQREVIGRPETSVRNCYHLLAHNTEERSSQLQRGGSLKSRRLASCFWGLANVILRLRQLRIQRMLVLPIIVYFEQVSVSCKYVMNQCIIFANTNRNGWYVICNARCRFYRAVLSRSAVFLALSRQFLTFDSALNTKSRNC